MLAYLLASKVQVSKKERIPFHFILLLLSLSFYFLCFPLSLSLSLSLFWFKAFFHPEDLGIVRQRGEEEEREREIESVRERGKERHRERVTKVYKLYITWHT